MSQVSVDKVIAVAREFVAAEAAAVGDLAARIDESFVRVARLILDTPGKVVLTGAGTTGYIAHRTAHLLSVSGTPAFYLNPSDALHGSMGALRSSDILIAISRGGESGEINTLVDLLQGEQVTVIALTCAAESTLGRTADITVALDQTPYADPGNLLALGSTLAQGAWLDALTVVLMRARQHSWEKVHHAHPGGAVGLLDELPPEVETLDIPRFEATL
ncbi:MAG: sugar isomerase [Microbacteriaceae bacterium]|jgi:D-arabinose 5-phosphate isomerase GutQ|nr:sugar isomerase [Microbacteriaceae bacterium]